MAYFATFCHQFIFEGKFLRSIFGGIQIDGIWGRRINAELYRTFKNTDEDYSDYFRITKRKESFEKLVSLQIILNGLVCNA